MFDKLAVSLALRFNGEVINGDALQLYKGLPIITNKLSEFERRDVPHHLLGCIDLEQPSWTVRDYSQHAKTIVEDIRSRGKLPIIVGGTHYYVQSIVSPKSIMANETGNLESSEGEKAKWPILNASTERILAELQKVDPEMAERWHPRDRRKIQRSLEIWLQTGRRPSEIYLEQKNSNSDPQVQGLRSDDASFLSYDTLVLWTHAPISELYPRLEDRVDKMVSNGLLTEAETMYTFVQSNRAQGLEVDESRGIFVAIGYKEFLPVFGADNPSENIRSACIERTKIATRQYAKRQTRWIRYKLLPSVAETGSLDRTFLLDATSLTEWQTNVADTAACLTDCFLRASGLPAPKSLSDVAHNMLVIEDKPTMQSRHCEACEKTLMTEALWKLHLSSKGHRRSTQPKIDWGALYPKTADPGPNET